MEDENKLLYETLQELVDLKEIAILYIDDEDTSTFSVGYILAYSIEEIVMAYVDEFGNNDGILGKKIHDIIKLEYRSKYSIKIQRLSKIKGEHIDFISLQSDSLFLDIMIYALNFEKVVSIELLDRGKDDVIGYITSIEGNSAKIKMINCYGEYDGEIIINIKDITHIVCDTEYEKSLDLLYSRSITYANNMLYTFSKNS